MVTLRTQKWMRRFFWILWMNWSVGYWVDIYKDFGASAGWDWAGTGVVRVLDGFTEFRGMSHLLSVSSLVLHFFFFWVMVGLFLFLLLPQIPLVCQGYLDDPNDIGGYQCKFNVFMEIRSGEGALRSAPYPFGVSIRWHTNLKIWLNFPVLHLIQIDLMTIIIEIQRKNRLSVVENIIHNTF